MGSSNPDNLGFIDAYWYWRIRAETTIMDPENLPKKSYQQLCRDMGLTIVNEAAEHLLGVIELYEYLKSSPFIGPFGTVTNPVLVPATHIAVAAPLARALVVYELPDNEDVNPIDPDVNDVFDFKMLEKGN